MLVSLGLDAHKDDPISSFKLETDDFGTLGARVAEMDFPTLVVLEGGYALESIGSNTVAFLSAMNRL